MIAGGLPMSRPWIAHEFPMGVHVGCPRVTTGHRWIAGGLYMGCPRVARSTFLGHP